jgi:hypothetical protein
LSIKNRILRVNMDEYKNYVIKELKEDEFFNLFSEIEVMQCRRDAACSLHDFELYEDCQSKVEFLQYQLLFHTISEN